jgi:hypothetical protein
MPNSVSVGQNPTPAVASMRPAKANATMPSTLPTSNTAKLSTISAGAMMTAAEHSIESTHIASHAYFLRHWV